MDFKSEFTETRNSLLHFDLEEEDELCKQQTEIEHGIFYISLSIKSLLQP